MSKLKMLKFEAATLQKDGKAFLERLQRLGVAELCQVEDKRLFVSSATDNASLYDKSADTVSSAIKILSARGVSFGGGMFSGRRELSEKQYLSMSEKVGGVLDDAYDILGCSRLLNECSAEITRCTTLLDSYAVWKDLDIPASGVRTESSCAFAGSLSGEYTAQSLTELVSANLPHINEYCIDIVYSSKLITCITVVCHKSVEKELLSFLRSISFTAPADMADAEFSERIAQLEKSIEECNIKKQEADKKLSAYKDSADLFKFALDFFTAKADEYRAMADVGFSDSTMYIRGYIPEKCAYKLSRLVTANSGAVVYSDPDENDDVPVALSNGAFSEPVESIVEMYSMPGKGDIDPSAAMAFFYYLLFGMMLSDAGYGLVLLLGSLAILKFTSVEGSMRKMLKMFVYCGISTVFWGALFGSWFGDVIPVIFTNFLGKPAPKVALWFDPISDPITLLLFSFVIGICHLFLGLILLGRMKWKDGDRVGAICDTVPVMLTVTGAAPLAAGVLVKVPAAVTGIASYLAIAGVILIVLTSSRSGNIFVRLGGGLYALYNIASGYLSDILSYSRLLALGLATGSIGSVVNMLAVMIDAPVIKYIVFVLVFIVGHSLNMAINVLGAYVHTNRLQFVELFGKFYEGGGRAFKPFKLNTKYFKLKEEIKND